MWGIKDALTPPLYGHAGETKRLPSPKGGAGEGQMGIYPQPKKLNPVHFLLYIFKAGLECLLLWAHPHGISHSGSNVLEQR